MVTGLQTAEGRLSPRMVFIGLAVITITVSEFVARYSLPPTCSTGGSGDSQGIMTVLIPFKILNSYFFCFQMLEMVQGALTYLFINWLDVGNMLGLELLDLDSLTNSASAMRSSSASWTPTLMLVCLLASMSKAKAHAWRKLEAWWEEHQLTAKCRRVKRFCVSASSRRAAYQVESDLHGTEQLGMEQMGRVQGRQKLEAGLLRKTVKTKHQNLESSQSRALPWKPNQTEPDQSDHPLATSNMRKPHLVLRQPKNQVFLVSEEIGKQCETREERQDPTEYHQYEEHRVIMVRPVDNANMHL